MIVKAREEIDPAPEIARLRRRLQAEEHKLSAVQEIGRALASTLDLDRLLALIMDKVTQLLEADRSTLYLVTEDGRELWSKIAQGGAEQTIRLKMGEGIAGWVAQSGEVASIPEAYADPRFFRSIDHASGYRTQSILCVPIRNPLGRVISVIQVLNKRGGPFTTEDETLLHSLGAQVAISIEYAKLYQSVVDKNARLLETQDKLRGKMNELDILFAVERDMHQAGSLDDMMGRLLAHAMELVGAGAGTLLLRDGQTDRADRFYVRALPMRDAKIHQATSPVEGSVAARVTSRRKPQMFGPLAPETGGAARFWDAFGVVPQSVLCAPLLTTDGALGAIELVNKATGAPFAESDLQLLTLITSQASSVIELELGKQNRANQSRLAALGEALSSVLHDFKTPMTIISGYAQLMAQVADAGQRSQYVSQILKQFDHMDAMAREVLAFARGESNLLIQKVYLQTFLEDLVAHLSQSLASSGVGLQVDLEYQGVAFFDEVKLRRVVFNLARNAAEALEGKPGGKCILSTRAEEGKFVLSMADNGPGIPDDIQGRLFDPFASSGKKEGTGLGLAIVKRIVDEHGGEISYETSRRKGTTFRVKLPLERKPPRPRRMTNRR